MPGYANVADYVDSLLNGQSTYSVFRKTPTQSTQSGRWFDLSMSPGNPRPQYYAASPEVSIALAQSTDGGLFHGANQSGKQKFLHRLLLMCNNATSVPLALVLQDYLIYYPFLDESSTDYQPLTTSATLPRYTDGAGVQIMAVVVAGQTGGGTFTVTYTNSAGVAGRVTAPVLLNAQNLNGTLINTQSSGGTQFVGPYLPLQGTDTGVQLIEGIQFSAPDVGLLTLVLVKPIATITIRGIDAPVEVLYFRDTATLPTIEDDAYLNFICHPVGSLASGNIYGEIEVGWN